MPVNSDIGFIEDWFVRTLAALQYNGAPVFNKVDRWKHQIDLTEGSGIESFGRCSPFAFVCIEDGEVTREGDFDANEKLTVKIAIGKESSQVGAARIGSDTDATAAGIGVDMIRELIIAAIDRQYPGENIPCDDAHYESFQTTVSTAKQYAIEMRFNVNYIHAKNSN